MARVQQRFDDEILEASNTISGGEPVPMFAFNEAKPIGERPAMIQSIADKPLSTEVDVMQPPRLNLKLLAIGNTEVTPAKVRKLLRDPRLPLLGRPEFDEYPDLEWNCVYNNNRPAIEQWMAVRILHGVCERIPFEHLSIPLING